MSHIVDECPAVRAQGDHNWSSWTDQLRFGVPMFWRHCFECIREEWEFESPGKLPPEFRYAIRQEEHSEPDD